MILEKHFFHLEKLFLHLFLGHKQERRMEGKLFRSDFENGLSECFFPPSLLLSGLPYKTLKIFEKQEKSPSVLASTY